MNIQYYPLSSLKQKSQHINWISFTKKKKKNVIRIERLKKQESLGACHLIQDDKAVQVKRIIERLHEQLKSMNKDISCKHTEFKNLKFWLLKT